MDDNEFLLFDRITKIQSVIRQYGEENFAISFSGGKDSTVLSWLVDEAMPGNTIPRVYADTGIEIKMIRDFVMEKAKNDDRIKIIRPTKPIKPTLEEVGYPFKSKKHSAVLAHYQKTHDKENKWVSHYLSAHYDRNEFNCPERLKYQFNPEFTLKVSDKCCEEMKEKPIKRWQKENKRPYAMLGLRRDEGGGDKAQLASLSRAKSCGIFSRLLQSPRTGKNGSLKKNTSRYARSIYRLSTSIEPGAKVAHSIRTFNENWTRLKGFYQPSEENANGYGDQYTRNIGESVTA